MIYVALGIGFAIFVSLCGVLGATDLEILRNVCVGLSPLNTVYCDNLNCTSQGINCTSNDLSILEM